jgi:excisionase family DNA binding protein
MTNRDLPLTGNELRQILAEALIGAAQALRRPASKPELSDSEDYQPFPGILGTPRLNRLALSMGEVAETLGIGRTTVYRLTSSGQLPSIQIGKRRLVPIHALDEWIRSLPTSRVLDFVL